MLFVTACPLVAWCRTEATRRVGNIQQVALGERFDILLLWFSESAETSGLSADGDSQEWWLRLNYANAQAIAMEEYDLGRPGRSFGFAVYSLVPRMLWPNKPDMTEVGIDLNEMVAGHRHSSMSIGVMGEAYWNGGWWMVVAVACFLGVVFAWLKQTATQQMGRNQWLYLPCIFIGIRMGYRIDGWFVADYFGTIVIYGFYSWVVYAIYSPLVGYSLVDSGRRPGLVTSK